MKIELELRDGKRKLFPEPVAKVLIKRGLGKVPEQVEKVATYQTRDMRADESELDALKAEADRRGIHYHHRAGVVRLRELLEGQ